MELSNAVTSPPGDSDDPESRDLQRQKQNGSIERARDSGVHSGLYSGIDLAQV